MHVTFIEVDPQGPEATSLLQLAAAEARALYPELHPPNATLPSNPPLPANGVYLVAFVRGRAAAMGAHRPVDDVTTELKRVFVVGQHRRKGLGQQLVLALEAHARQRGFQRIRLETGNRQGPAMALYEANGYRRVPAFGPHASDPTSVCYAKRLD